MFKKTVNKPAQHAGRVGVPDHHHGDPLAAHHGHKFWQGSHKGSVCESTAGVDLKDRWRSHFRAGLGMAIDLATAQVRAIRRQISQAHIPNALGLRFGNGLRYDRALLRTPAA